MTSTGKVISGKYISILDYFSIELSDGELTITASDTETRVVSRTQIEGVEQGGIVAAPSKLLMDTLKEFADMPITIEVIPSTWEIKISWKSGALSIPGADPESYPAITKLAEERRELEIGAERLLAGINKTIFATADDELRPVMNGIFFNIEPSSVTFVADATPFAEIAIHTQGFGGIVYPSKEASQPT